MVKGQGTLSRLQKQQAIAATFHAPKSICACGHTGDGAYSQHGPSNNAALAPGHGSCGAAGCGCQKFSWAAHTDGFKKALEQA